MIVHALSSFLEFEEILASRLFVCFEAESLLLCHEGNPLNPIVKNQVKTYLEREREGM